MDLKSVYKAMINGEEKTIDVASLARKIEAEVARRLMSARDVVITSEALAKIADAVIKRELCGGVDCEYALYSEGGEALSGRKAFDELIMPHAWLHLAYVGGDEAYYLLIPPLLLDYLPEQKRKAMLGYALRVIRRLLELYEEDALSYSIKSDELIYKIARVNCWSFMPRICEWREDRALEQYYKILSSVYEIPAVNRME